MVLIMSIFSNGQNQYSSQTAKAEQLNDLRYAAKVITKEIRKADKVEVNGTSLTLGTDSSVIFTFNNISNEILQNGSTLISGIEKFSVLQDGRTLDIQIVSSDEENQRQNFTTEIYIREGVLIE